MQIGITHTVYSEVTDQNTAMAISSGAVRVFGTPMMAALMEDAALRLVAPYLEEGQTTVGIALNLTHTAATPVGMRVEATAVLTEIDGKTLTFSVSAKDECGLIGECIQKRAIVNLERFTEKTYQKLNR